MKQEDGHATASGLGAIGSIVTSYTRFLDDEIVIIVFSNNSASTLGYRSGFSAKSMPSELASIMLGERFIHIPEEPVQAQLSPEALDRYVGQYDYYVGLVPLYSLRFSFEFSSGVARSPLATITREGDALLISFEGTALPRTRIFPESSRKFFARGLDLQIVFTKTDLAGVLGFFVQYDNEDFINYKKKRE